MKVVNCVVLRGLCWQCTVYSLPTPVRVTYSSPNPKIFISISHLCAFKKYLYILLAFVINMFSTNKRCVTDVTDRPTSGLPSP